MTWDEPAGRSSSSPRVVEPSKPEDRFGREDTHEPDLFSALTPAPRPPRLPPHEATPRPKSPSSVLARASVEASADAVDLDVPTFDRRGVRPSLQAPRGERMRTDDVRAQPDLPGAGEPALFEPTPPPFPEPTPAQTPVATAPPPAVSAAFVAEPPRHEPALDALDDDHDLPFHSSSSDPGTLDTIAYLTNELAGSIAAFDERDERPRVPSTFGTPRSTPRTWVDTAETQVDDPDFARILGADAELDLADELDRPDEPAAAAPRIELSPPPERAPAWDFAEPELAAHRRSESEPTDPDPMDSQAPRRPAIATFVIERAAPLPAAEGSEASARGSDGARDTERASIDWDELRAARARDWAAFEAQATPAPPPIGKAARAPEPEPVVEAPRRAVPFRDPARDAEREQPRASAREVTRDLSRDGSREAPRATAPAMPAAPVISGETRIEPPPRWLDSDVPRSARRSWNDPIEPELLDDVDELHEADADAQDDAAPFTARGLAFAIDVSIVASTAVVAVLLGVIAFGTTDYQQIDFVRSFGVLDDAFNWLLALIALVYFSVSHAWTGATLGKAMLGLKVLRTDRGGPPSVGRSLLRTVGYAASSILGIGFLWALRAKRQGWHDLIAGTVVVRTGRHDAL